MVRGRRLHFGEPMGSATSQWGHDEPMGSGRVLLVFGAKPKGSGLQSSNNEVDREVWAE
jgi:hypothetical protein